MFFDIGWPELMLIGVVALVVIGPKDLPAALRVAGYWVRKARNMSREFQSSVEQMLREAELDEVRQELKKVTDINLDHEVNKIMEPVHDLNKTLDPVDDPAIAGAAATVPRPEVPDYLDHTPAPADPVPPTAEPMATEETATAETAPAEQTVAEPTVTEHIVEPAASTAEEHPAPAGAAARP